LGRLIYYAWFEWPACEKSASLLTSLSETKKVLWHWPQVDEDADDGDGEADGAVEPVLESEKDGAISFLRKTFRRLTFRRQDQGPVS